MPLRGEGKLKLGPFPENISFVFGPGTNASRAPVRLRYKLEGFENDWQRELTA